MPAAIDWTPGMDSRLLAGHASGLTWDGLADAMRMGRSTVIERARRLGLPKQKYAAAQTARARDRDDPPLRAGHPDSLAMLRELTPSIELGWP